MERELSEEIESELGEIDRSLQIDHMISDRLCTVFNLTREVFCEALEAEAFDEAAVLRQQLEKLQRIIGDIPAEYDRSGYLTHLSVHTVSRRQVIGSAKVKEVRVRSFTSARGKATAKPASKAVAHEESSEVERRTPALPTNGRTPYNCSTGCF